jgi:hypothetical protein
VISFSIAFLLMCFLGTLTVTRAIIGSSTGFLGYFTLYYALRFGSGRDLIQSWYTGIAQMLSNRKFLKKKLMDEGV